MDKFGVIHPDVTPARAEGDEKSGKKLASYTEKKIADEAERRCKDREGINSPGTDR